MAYNKQTWVNGESQANATRLSHIEDGIYNAYNVSLIAITNIEPSECNEGDKYFNTTDNLIYTATDTDTWSETGETPISDKTYVLLEDGSTYMYDGTTLTRIGGSEQEVANEYNESTEIPYSCDYVNGATLDIYSLSEVKTNKVWIDNKPIYRKVVFIETLPNASSEAYDTGITNVDKMISILGTSLTKTTFLNAFPLPYVGNYGGTPHNNEITWLGTNGQIRIVTDTDRSAQCAYVILEYTKTS